MGNRMTRTSRVMTIVGMLLLSLAGSLLFAQTAKFKAGDEVQVFFLNQWWPAKVVDTNPRGDVLAEYEFAGAKKSTAFKKNEVRFAFEADAIGPARNWSDASGQFKIRAALMRVDETTITLRKQDMSEVKVPVAKLSESDQRFIKSLKKEYGAALERPPEPPPSEQFDRSAASESAVAAADAGQRQSITPDPLPSYLKIQEGGVAFPMGDIFDRVGAVLPLGGADSWLLAAIESGHRSSQGVTRVLWASMTKKEIGGQQLLPYGEVVLDYHPSSHRLLTYALIKPDGNNPDVKNPFAAQTESLTLWEVLPADKQIKPIIRWNAGAVDRTTREPWGRIIHADLVLHRWKDQEYIAWDAKGKRAAYRIVQESFFAPLATLSGGRKYLFLPEDKRVRIFDTATGQLASTLPTDDGAAAVAVTEDGQRAAVLGRTKLTVWNLTDATISGEEFQAEAIATPIRANLRWVDNEHLMADNLFGQVLFSLKHKLALWSYQFDGDAVRETEGRRVRDIVDGHLIYAASVTAGQQRGLAVGAVKLPGPKVAEVAATLNPETLMVVKPGSAVRLDIRADANTPQVQAALEREVTANGWVINPSATTVIIAEMKRGETQQVTYRSFSLGAEETVTVTPFISEVRIEAAGKPAWASMTSSGVPPFLRLQEGQTVQSEVDKWQHPNVEFFSNLKIPERILDPAKRSGVGKTSVTNRGLIVE